jgi:NADH-quinone oxidoreductase subunit D
MEEPPMRGEPSMRAEPGDARELTIHIGPQHPSTHGVLHLITRIEGEQIVDVDPDIGYLHRGMEKMAENRTYAQFMPLTDRLDYVSAMAGNWAYARTVEKLADIEVPERAEFLRVIMCELQRIASHLLSIGAAGMDAGAWSPFLYVLREREQVLDLFEAVCGARLTYNYIRIGGVARDIPDGWVEQCREFCDSFPAKVDDYEKLLFDNYIFRERTVGIGVLTAKEAIAGGASGPVLRASGVAWDLRANDPYSVYPLVDFDVVTREGGDSFDRMYIRLEELRQSARIVRQALELMPPGPVFAQAVPRLVEPPAGETYDHIESPRGELGFYLVSDGGPRPYRLKVRSPAFSNLSLLPIAARGHTLSDLVVILGSLDPIFGEVDR